MLVTIVCQPACDVIKFEIEIKGGPEAPPLGNPEGPPVK